MSQTYPHNELNWADSWAKTVLTAQILVKQKGDDMLGVLLN